MRLDQSASRRPNRRSDLCGEPLDVPHHRAKDPAIAPFAYPLWYAYHWRQLWRPWTGGVIQVMRGMGRNPRQSAIRLVVLLGLVRLSAEEAYEDARSICARGSGGHHSYTGIET